MQCLKVILKTILCSFLMLLMTGICNASVNKNILIIERGIFDSYNYIYYDGVIFDINELVKNQKKIERFLHISSSEVYGTALYEPPRDLAGLIDRNRAGYTEEYPFARKSEHNQSSKSSLNRGHLTQTSGKRFVSAYSRK